ncbi:MAG: NAD(P)-dependent oxidoreductase [Chlorobi bacterium CHB2]|nr:NAD(P)-dependent oxidoreductase [Chlorobi bacterium CHB2]
MLTEPELDLAMTQPTEALVREVPSVRSPLLVLGGSGKMGPSLAAMAKRAAELAGVDLRVIAVARFSDQAARSWLRNHGVETVACDLLDPTQVATLPNAGDIIYMAGRKFGTTDNPALTWAMNVLPPEYVCRRFPDARMVALSTGCVYPLVPVGQGGSREGDELTPIGEYSNACVARERVFEHLSATVGTRVCLVRLNYALDLRYGVLVDIATKVLNGVPIDLSIGYLNAIWQRDANAMILRALPLAQSPAFPLNLTGPETLSVRQLAERFGELFGRAPVFAGSESPVALLNDSSNAHQLLGPPETPIEQVIEWTARWLQHNGRTLGKPTHYEVADGRY